MRRFLKRFRCYDKSCKDKIKKKESYGKLRWHIVAVVELGNLRSFPNLVSNKFARCVLWWMIKAVFSNRIFVCYVPQFFLQYIFIPHPLSYILEMCKVNDKSTTLLQLSQWVDTFWRNIYILSKDWRSFFLYKSCRTKTKLCVTTKTL